MADNVVNLSLYKLLHAPSPWPAPAPWSVTKDNEALLALFLGVPAQIGTSETDVDWQNPNIRLIELRANDEETAE